MLSPIGFSSFPRTRNFSSHALRDLSTISALTQAKSSECRKSVASSDEPDGSFPSATPNLNTFPGFSNRPLLRGPFSELSSTPCRKYCTALKHYCWNVTCDTPSFPCSTANALRLPRTLLIETSLPNKLPSVELLWLSFSRADFRCVLSCAAPRSPRALRLSAETARASMLGVRRW